MKNILMNYVKSIKVLGKIYSYIGSTLLKVLSIFVKIDEKQILFNSFGGKKFDDSPKIIYEAMRLDSRFKNHKFVWAFHEPERHHVEGATVIKTDNINYFITALKSKVWITNSSIERGLTFKKKNTLYVNTWHGTPMKLMGCDETKEVKIPKRNYDIQLAQSEYEMNIFSRVFNIDKSNFLVCGLPRNDELASENRYKIEKYKKLLNLPIEKKVIMYAPTFREYERDKVRNCIMSPPIDFRLWKEHLGDDYIVLLRAHYEVARVMTSCVDNEFIIDVSDYPHLNDLLLATDVLISDYSSIMIDFSILDRPIYLYTYDYDEYNKKRGLYFDVRETLPGGSITEKELIDLIKNHKNYDYNQLKLFRETYVTAYGNATEQILNRIYESLT